MQNFTLPKSGYQPAGWVRYYQLILAILTAGCLLFMALAWHLWGAVELRTDWTEVGFMTLWGGGLWTMAAYRLLDWMGVSLRHDVIEQKNSAALIAYSGAWIALSLVFAGGGIGEGAAYLENIFTAGVGAIGLLGLWFLLELGTQISRSVAEERDLASGLRLGSFLIAVGLIFGRAEAGDWHSAAATVHDFFHDGWTASVLVLLAWFGEWFLRPSRLRPSPSWPACGLLPALLYLALSIAWVWHLGPWEGMP